MAVALDGELPSTEHAAKNAQTGSTASSRSDSRSMTAFRTIIQTALTSSPQWPRESPGPHTACEKGAVSLQLLGESGQIGGAPEGSALRKIMRRGSDGPLSFGKILKLCVLPLKMH